MKNECMKKKTGSFPASTKKYRRAEMIAERFLCSFLPLFFVPYFPLHLLALCSEKKNLMKGAFAFAACYEEKDGERANQ
jgi:hypothetical protein